MKKYILILLLFTGFLQAQTLQNPTFGNTTTNTLKVKTNTEASTSTKLSTQETDGSINFIQPINVPIPYAPANYSISNQSIGQHLTGIDTRLGQISSTTAGITQRVYFTADNTTVTAGTFFTSSLTGKGSTATGSPPALVLADNTKGYFTKDVISVAFPAATIGYAGSYTGQLTVSATPTPVATQQRFTVEIYRTDNGGTPIASGVSGAPTGDLGVTVVAILDSGILNLTAGSITNIPVTGILTQNITLNTGERLRYHVSAAKIGFGGGSVTFGVYYGSSYNSYYDVPVAITTDAVLNKSAVTGVTNTDALNTLNSNKIDGSGTSDFVSLFTGSKSIGNSILKYTSNGFRIGSQKTSFGRAFGISDLYTTMNIHIYDDYSILNSSSTPASGFSTFDASTEMRGTANYDHFQAYQSRLLFTGSGNITGDYGMTGIFVQNVHTGTGSIINNYGTRIFDVGGSGPIGFNYGLKIESISRGTVNWSIYSGDGDSRFSGNIHNENSHGFYSYSVGDKYNGNQKYLSFVSDAIGSSFYTTGVGTQTPADFVFNSYNGVVTERFRISASTGRAIASPAVLSTELATLGQVNSVARPYKVYTALLTQSGTSAPTATVLENTLGGTVVWTRSGVGSYVATLTGAFVLNKTSFSATVNGTPIPPSTSSVNIYGNRATADTIAVSTVTNTGFADGTISPAYIEIRVYN